MDQCQSDIDPLSPVPASPATGHSMSVEAIPVRPSLSRNARTSQIRQLKVMPRKLCENMRVLCEKFPVSDFSVALMCYFSWN